MLRVQTTPQLLCDSLIVTAQFDNTLRCEQIGNGGVVEGLVGKGDTQKRPTPSFTQCYVSEGFLFPQWSRCWSLNRSEDGVHEERGSQRGAKGQLYDRCVISHFHMGENI